MLHLSVCALQDNFTIALCALLMLLTVMALSFTSWALVHMLTAADWEIEGKHSFFPAHTVVFVITSSLVFTAVVLATVCSPPQRPPVRVSLLGSLACASCHRPVQHAAELGSASQTGHAATCIDIANGAAIQLSMVTMPLLIVLGTIMSDEASLLRTPSRAEWPCWQDNAAFTLVFSTLSLTGAHDQLDPAPCAGYSSNVCYTLKVEGSRGLCVRCGLRDHCAQLCHTLWTHRHARWGGDGDGVSPATP